jgi:hypothetical protein
MARTTIRLFLLELVEERETQPPIDTTAEALPESTQVRLKPSLAKTLGNVVEMPRKRVAR